MIFHVFRRQILLKEIAQHFAAARVPELAQRLRLDLADALARHAETLPDLLERA